MGRIKPENHSENKHWNERYWRKGHRGWLTPGGKASSKTGRAAARAAEKK